MSLCILEIPEILFSNSQQSTINRQTANENWALENSFRRDEFFKSGLNLEPSDMRYNTHRIEGLVIRMSKLRGNISLYIFNIKYMIIHIASNIFNNKYI